MVSVSIITERDSVGEAGAGDLTVDVVEAVEDRRVLPGNLDERSRCETSELARRVRNWLGGVSNSQAAASVVTSSCQLMGTSSVNRLKIVNRLESVPPLPTSLRSW